MSEPLQVGQFAIVDHEPVEMGPNAGVFWGRGPAGDRPELYIVAEGTTPAGESFAGHLVSGLGQAWQNLDLSLTGSLQRVFRQAGNDLRDWNRKSIAQHRVRLGMTCAGRRGNQVVIAQAGPSIAFSLHKGQFRVHRPQGESMEPLGGPQDVAPTLVKIDLEPGDRLLILSTTAASEFDDEIAAGLMALGDDHVLANLYRLVEHVRNMTAILLARPLERQQLRAPERTGSDDGGDIIDATIRRTDSTEPAEQEAAQAQYQPSLFIASYGPEKAQAARSQLGQIEPRPSIAPDMPDVAVDVPAPLRKVSGDDTLARIAAERGLHINRPLNALGPGSAEALRIPVSEPHGNTEGARSKRRESFSRGLATPEVPSRPSVEDDNAPPVEELAADRQATLMGVPRDSGIIMEPGEATISASPLVQVRPQMKGRWKGGSLGGGKIEILQRAPRPWWIIAGGVAALVLIVGYLALPNMLGESAGERYDTLIRGAEQQLSISAVQADPAEKRTALTSAQAYLLEARDIDPNGSDVQRLLKNVEQALTSLDNVHTPVSVDVVASLEQFGDKPVTPARLVAGGETAYILDNGSGQVIAVNLVDTRFRAIFSEQADEQRGKPIAITFTESGDIGGPNLLIADSNRSLWAYNPTAGLRVLVFTPPQNLTITDIAMWGPDLFVLDATAGVIYQFTAFDGGFASAPVEYLKSDELKNARRLIADGELITGDANGDIHRYSGQASLVLSQAGIDSHLVAVQTPQVLGEGGEIAIVDPANDRIVVFRRDGTFDRQYKHKDFAALTGLAVDGEEVLVFSGGILRRVVLDAPE